LILLGVFLALSQCRGYRCCFVLTVIFVFVFALLFIAAGGVSLVIGSKVIGTIKESKCTNKSNPKTLEEYIENTLFWWD